ncbi:uncharacterized protein FA14DRAFT_3577 [Meira miltonrushii]|uniref:SH3 domain-containing protein n=1 Tax=Meira miltonrushii TaxID=1280837 RepID=A0A316VG17_9BASI|nr:uncharacterized protein FA14DRAFT_3577 [Meira miltonrushii]PWN36522.1 hypothetical protein FA14DRAFT_3577 [Meira miltonrushii]
MTSEVSFPYEAIAVKKYKSPHKNDLSFAKGDRLRVTALAPKDDDEEEEDDDEDDRWLIGETLDGTKTGTFPASHVEQAPASAPLADSVEEGTTTTESADVLSPTSAVKPEGVSEATSDQVPKAEPVTEIPAKSEADTAGLKEAEQDKAAPIPAPVEPAKKPSSPPLAPKPSGLAARIAAFNKPQDAPPPIPRGKPGGGWKPPPPAPGGSKPILPGPSAAQLNRTTNRSADKVAASMTTEQTTTPESVVKSQKDKSNAGFSAADAQTSIKMSLKERMAALQRNESSSSQREAAAAKPAPKPAPGKIDEEKRAAALASMGSPTKQDTEEPVAGEKEDASELPLQNDESEAQPKEVSTESEEAAAVQISTTTEDGEEKTEEEIEAERRAAIAKRMAALGGRRMGGGSGPAMFGGPAPPSKPRKLSTDSRSTLDASSDVGTKDSVDEVTAPAAIDQDKEEEVIKSEKTLAVPRRTAPPRKKKSSISSQPSSASPSTDEPARQQSIEEGQEEKEEVDPSTSKTEGLAAGAAVAGAAGIGAAALTEEPKSTLDEDKEEEKPVAPQVIEPEADDAPTTLSERRPTQDSIVSRKTEQSAITDADSFEPSTPVSQSELEEHARLLEAFVRTPEVESNQPELTNEDEDELNTPAPNLAEGDPIVDRAAIASPPPPNIAPPPAPSARPPVPKSSLPPSAAEDDDTIQRFTSPPPSRAPPVPRSSLPPAQKDDDAIQRFTSPPPSRAPPVPKSSLPPAQEDEPRTLSPAPTRAPPIPTASPVGRRESSLMASVEGLQDDVSNTEEVEAPSAPVLAAPKPRMAVPADESDDEEEREAQQPAQKEETAPAPAEELTEEEEERQRRSRLAERMARMGGMPIMGAPMPFRKPPKPAAEPEEEAEVEEQPTPSEPIEQDDEEEEGRELDPVPSESPDEEEEQPIIPLTASRSAIASPPPIPTKSPPPPARSPDMAKRASQSFGLGGDLARSGSTRARPPVPVVSHSRGATNEEIAEMEAAADPVASQEPPRIASPPALPSSPPPRPPSRAPPGRQGSIASIGQIHQDSSADGGLARVPSVKLDRSSSIGSAKAPMSSSLMGVQPSAPSARDIDLMPSSQWWRHGRPVKLPPTLMRPDAVRTVNVQDEGSTHLIRVDLIFEDYSSTAISVKYQDDDANEEHTEIAQRHNFAPGRPQAQEMVSWSQHLGSRIARQASTFLTKGQQMQLGDGTSRGFITALIALSTNENALPPVGSSFGAIVLAQAATTPVDQGSDEIRPGDIVALHGADFKGKRGLTPYHVTYGTAQEPAFACVLEATSESSKKRKLRCILVPTSSATGKPSKSGLPEEVTLRLDDVKSGLLRVFRVAPKHGWLPE